MKRCHFVYTVVPLLLVLAGCASFSTARYSSSPDTAIALRNLHQKYPTGKFSVGEFTAPIGNGRNEITCRGAGPVATPDKTSFTTYIQSSLADELKLADMYTDAGGILITGHIEKVDFSSTSGRWIINGQIAEGAQTPLEVKEDYNFDTSFAAVSACNETALAFERAVQDFVSKIVASPQFEAALKANASK